MRADASIAQGTGHVMRCLALAQAFQDRGGSALFAMARDAPNSVRERIVKDGVKVADVISQPGTTDDAQEVVRLAHRENCAWVVVDGYHFGPAYQRELKDAGLRVLFVGSYGSADDYCARLIVNPGLDATPALYPMRETETELLLGPRFALLRREFREWKNWKRQISTDATKILITMGGSDPNNVTTMVVKALRCVNVNGLEVTAVLGGENPHSDAIEQEGINYPHKFRVSLAVSNMPELLAWADIAISAGGGTCYELAFLQLPMVIMATADDQGTSGQSFAQRKAAIDVGRFSDLKPEQFSESVTTLLADFEKRSDLARHAGDLVDAEGSHRVIERMFS